MDLGLKNTRHQYLATRRILTVLNILLAVNPSLLCDHFEIKIIGKMVIRVSETMKVDLNCKN